jgi:hypothetical protein
MTTAISIPTVEAFNYAALDADVAGRLRLQAERIRDRVKATTASIIEIGNDLIAVKQHLEHGAFTRWIEAECGFSIRSAEHYIRVAEFSEGKNETVSFLSPTVAYKVAAKSAPADIVEKVLAAAEEKKPLSAPVVDDMFRQARARLADERRKKHLAAARKKDPKYDALMRRRQNAYSKAREEEAVSRKKAASLLVSRIGLEAAEAVANILSDPHNQSFDFVRALKTEIEVRGAQ